MSNHRNVICERIRFLFRRATEQGADTDHWDTGPGEVDEICKNAFDGDFELAFSRVEGASDSRWSELQWYLQGLSAARSGDGE